jgi:hypothetical protein
MRIHAVDSRLPGNDGILGMRLEHRPSGDGSSFPRKRESNLPV